jgi:hypothetical protein
MHEALHSLVHTPPVRSTHRALPLTLECPACLPVSLRSSLRVLVAFSPLALICSDEEPRCECLCHLTGVCRYAPLTTAWLSRCCVCCCVCRGRVMTLPCGNYCHSLGCGACQPQDPLRQGVDRGALSKLKSSLAVLLSNHRDGPQARHAPNAICAYSIRVHFM